MNIFTHYFLRTFLIVSLLIENINPFFGSDDSITIEKNIDFEKDSNEDDKNITVWYDFISSNLEQQGTSFTKQNSLCCFYTNQYHSKYIHNISTPPPQYYVN